MVVVRVTGYKSLCLKNDSISMINMLVIVVRGDCLPMSGSTRTSWKYDDERCVMVMWSQKKHVLFDCNLYMDVRRRWKEKMDAEHADVIIIIIAVGRMRQRLPSFPVLFYGLSPYISL